MGAGAALRGAPSLALAPAAFGFLRIFALVEGFVAMEESVVFIG
jgi:hypothetical protein